MQTTIPEAEHAALRYRGKKPKKAKQIPPLHSFMIVTVGTVKKEDVVGYTITRGEFKDAVEGTFSELEAGLRWDQAVYSAEVLAQVREIITPTVESIDRFPLGTWMDADRGCGCIVGEAIVANDAINRHHFMAIESGEPIESLYSVGDILRGHYDALLADALLAFGRVVDRRVANVVARTRSQAWPTLNTGKRDRWGELVNADRVVFIQDED